MILLDTCSLLWLVGQQSSLSENAKVAIEKNNGNIFISAISACEISIKVEKGLIVLPQPMDTWFKMALELHGISCLSIDYETLIHATKLPALHRDPADRIIIATSFKNQLSIITPDQHISKYPNVTTIW